MADSSNPPLSTPTSNPDLELQKSQIDASNTTKAQGNSAFSKAQYDNAIECYDEAYEGIKHTDAWFEQGVLKSNIAACRLKLEEWGKAIEAAGEALGALERADPGMVGERRGKKEEERTDTLQEEGDEDREVKDEKVSKEDEGDRDADGEVGAFDPNAEKQKRKEILLFFGHDEEDVARMRAKALLRRASARLKLGGWAALQGADEGEKAVTHLFWSLAANTVDQITRSWRRCCSCRHWTRKRCRRP